MLLEYTPTWKCMARNLLLCHLLAIETIGKSTQIFSSTWRNMTFVSLRSFILKVCWAVYWQKTGYTHMNWAMYSLATFCPELRHPFLPRCINMLKCGCALTCLMAQQASLSLSISCKGLGWGLSQQVWDQSKPECPLPFFQYWQNLSYNRSSNCAKLLLASIKPAKRPNILRSWKI